jgi:hypothetical protein
MHDLVFDHPPMTICHGSAAELSVNKMIASLKPLTWKTTLVRPLILTAGWNKYWRAGDVKSRKVVCLRESCAGADVALLEYSVKFPPAP